MRVFAEAMHAVGGALLEVAVLLLLEELSFAGLVRLVLAGWPGRVSEQREKISPSGLAG